MREQQFTTESGQRFYWTEKQTRNYRAARAILAPRVRSGGFTEAEVERQAIEAAQTWTGPAAAGAEQNAGAPTAEAAIDTASIYARRNEAYVASLQRTPGARADTAAQAPEAPAAEAFDPYAFRARVHQSAADRGIS